MKGRWRKDKRSDPTLQGPAVVAVSPSPGEPLSSTSTVSSLPSLSEYPPPLPHSEGLGTSPGEDLLRADKGGRTDAAAEEDRGRSCSKTRVSQSQPAPPSREYLQDTASFFSRQRMAQLAKHCPSAEVQQRNVGALYACQSIKKNKEFALCDTDTHAAFKKALEGGSIYLPQFCCKRDDLTLFNRLFEDLRQYAAQVDGGGQSHGDEEEHARAREEESKGRPSVNRTKQSPEPSTPSCPPPAVSPAEADPSRASSSSPSSSLPFAGAVNWSRHLKHENPSFSPTFREIIKKLSEYFEVDVYATRLNLYMHGSHWKPLHKDSHAYSPLTNQTEDITVGASFGASRELEFVHDKNQEFRFVFPQHNGDVFAFNSEINQLFKHGVPRCAQTSTTGRAGGGGEEISPRFSIILWGRRTRLTEKNASKTELQKHRLNQGGLRDA